MSDGDSKLFEIVEEILDGLIMDLRQGGVIDQERHAKYAQQLAGLEQSEEHSSVDGHIIGRADVEIEHPEEGPYDGTEERRYEDVEILKNGWVVAHSQDMDQTCYYPPSKVVEIRKHE